ncbi:hypothetical protein [Lysinibacillus fusiformis]|uniref:hypothetical protein n=1 Tax=Lysinibacillus fusiformis TaxID=28031 RepID=UPI0008894396|nr:hypothetical protein [Lysinibacillus fusiformis]SCX61872.1 hypothetical protein SAMN02787108_02981 [Lysinibacillus fusiformis]SDB44659.1 hypothetical protein SAMN02787070_03314 [Lysinibacillus fusiformis]SFI67127.1 hypothetical protein SAMN02787080_03331 [Lysinibacillus fusiformis]SFT11705.1 hypothetical protein SAMN02787099_02896 [Lysinibacillus fusiformis]
MKKWMLPVLFYVLWIGGCDSAPLLVPPKIQELTIVPDHIQQHIIAQERIQLLYEDDMTYYLVMFSKGNVLASVAANEDRLVIHFKEGSEHKKEAQPYVYAINKNPELTIIELYINGKSMAIDRMTMM